MFYWSKEKSDLEKLQKRYCRLMKSSYTIALKDKEKSDSINEEASRVLIEIKKLAPQKS
ncbi:Lacal_2735 family protein [Aquimarina litoralis]|uniref:Lacal_2735 family protein n=1 Tax=Aquimarina litoralis TaxID=584605 RepID=UPI001C5621CE|nr:Lacal_2735 family protein [Aquimarina litoralis]MBW1298238.1 Lacal_2735 family protein [Aquimarina litoralis]